jgi:hypothetical protein
MISACVKSLSLSLKIIKIYLTYKIFFNIKRRIVSFSECTTFSNEPPYGTIQSCSTQGFSTEQGLKIHYATKVHAFDQGPILLILVSYVILC